MHCLLHEEVEKLLARAITPVMVLGLKLITSVLFFIKSHQKFCEYCYPLLLTCLHALIVLHQDNVTSKLRGSMCTVCGFSCFA